MFQICKLFCPLKFSFNESINFRANNSVDGSQKIVSILNTEICHRIPNTAMSDLTVLLKSLASFDFEKYTFSEIAHEDRFSKNALHSSLNSIDIVVERLSQISSLSFLLIKTLSPMPEGKIIFEKCINQLKHYAMLQYSFSRQSLLVCLNVLAAFYDANDRVFTLPFSLFYIPSISANLNIKDEYLRWSSSNQPSFDANADRSLIDFPFLLQPERKAMILRIDNSIRMRHELQDAFFRALFAGAQSPHLTLRVRRDNLIMDSLVQLQSKAPYDLKKQLKVTFADEEAVDEGGVQKEFFQLAMRDLFDLKYGMFCSYPSSSSSSNNSDVSNVHYFSWFPFVIETEQELLQEYELVGKLFGIAIYNSIILDVSFPQCIYRKLLGQSVGLEDLKEFDPIMYRSLIQVMNCTEEEFDSFSIDNFTCLLESIDGYKHLVELKYQGSKIPVSWSDRQEWIALYVDVLLNKSVANQFNAFKRGFDAACSNSSLYTLFRAEEVEELVCGSRQLDFEQLEQAAYYENGYHAEHDFIQWFWAIIHEFNDEEKRKFLSFTTGSDRAPVGGLGKLHFIISRNGSDSDRLPTAHTCFNVLLLSEYSSKDKLKEMLRIAIENCEGFGLI